MFHLDEARTEAIEFGLVPNHSNVRRVVKAHDLVIPFWLPDASILW